MRTITLILSFLVISSCLTIEEYVVDYDYSYSGNFGKYRSFDFMQQEIGAENQQYDTYIKEAIKNRLEALGYVHKVNKPGLIISYKLFYNDFYMRAYTQPKLEFRVNKDKILLDEEGEIKQVGNPFEEEDEDEENEQEIRRIKDDYDPILCDLRQGSLYITMFDRKRRRSIWQGYASGIFGNQKFDNERYINRTVRKILDQYRVLSRDYIINQ